MPIVDQSASAVRPPPGPAAFDAAGIAAAAHSIRAPLWLVRDDQRQRIGVVVGATDQADQASLPTSGSTVVAALPPLFPEWLGDRMFGEVHGARFPYVVGEMANGLTTVQAVVAAARAGFIGFFGAAGLTPDRVAAAIAELQQALGDRTPWGSNLIHSPHEPAIEAAIVELYLRHQVRRVCASAYVALTPGLVRFAATGLRLDPRGRVLRRNHLFAKISRPEVARLFMAPAPANLLDALVAAGQLDRAEAELAARVPVAEDITVEADSGGHTDNRPLNVIFPVIAALRDEITAAHGYDRPIRVGAAGGLGTPAAVASAFALGASYVLTGSINQSAVESGLGATGKRLLAQASLSDVMMAPSADMFELGGRVQVLRRGTLFGSRAQHLLDLYHAHDSIETIPVAERHKLETDVFRLPLDQVWAETERFWSERDPHQVARATVDAKHKLALICRWYLGRSSRWAIDDDSGRVADFQIWCGPAMGAFNDWVRGSFLEDLAQRTVPQIGRNLLEGAAVITRAQTLRSLGLAVAPAAFQFRPRPLG